MLSRLLNQFREIVFVDTEFRANGGKDVDVRCVCAEELRSGRQHRVWIKSGLQCPYPIDNSTLFVAYYASAEINSHLSLGWPMPANILDLYPEVRAIRNGLPGKTSLLGALQGFGAEGLESAEATKEGFRNLAMLDRPNNQYSREERDALMDYCLSDVRMLRQLFQFVESYICQHLSLSLQIRGEYMRSCTLMERTGVPLDVPTLRRLQRNWDRIRLRLAGESLREFPFFDGLRFSHEKFEKFLVKRGLDVSWPSTAKNQQRKLDEDTWREQATFHPELEPARALYFTMRMNKLNIACAGDGRNRVMLGAFGTKTGRNRPSGKETGEGSFIFAPNRWVRFLIKPRKGWSVAYLDYESQEFGICAALSGDRNMLKCYLEGDPYLAFAKVAGAVPVDATKKSHGGARKQYKVVTLGVGYGMRWRTLARKTGLPELIARRLIGDYQAIFSVFCQWREAQLDRFVSSGTIETVLGWPLHKHTDYRPNTILNYGAQANAAEMLRIAIIEGHKRGVEICAPVMDAVLIQAPTQKIEDAVGKMTEAMNVASRVILNGFQLRVESKITSYPHRFTDEDGLEFWRKVTK
jgi:hypothetical protein